MEIRRRKRQPTPVFLPGESLGQRPGGLLFMGSLRIRHNLSNLACMHALEKEVATHSSFLAWRIPWTEEPGGLLSMGSHRVGHNLNDVVATAAHGNYLIKNIYFQFFKYLYFVPCSSVQFSRSVMSNSLRPHESQHARPPCPSQTPGVYSNSCPSSRWCHPAISSSVMPFSSCPQFYISIIKYVYVCTYLCLYFL